MKRTRRKRKQWKGRSGGGYDLRLNVFRIFMLLFAIGITTRLVYLQVVHHGFYEALASGQHELYEELQPERGTIFVQDAKDRELVPFATNQRRATVWAEPRHVDAPAEVADALSEALGYTNDQRDTLFDRLNQPSDPYEPIAEDVGDKTLEKIIAIETDGIRYTRSATRVYPEPSLGGHLTGFLGKNEEGNPSGKYGIEGWFDELLSGTSGILLSERDIAGRLITVGDHEFEPAIDGADVVLTIDRTVQFKVCQLLEETVKSHRADGGSVVILEPNTGRVMAMCSQPDYDPNVYNEVDQIQVFNNPAIFEAYEPGSIFKPLTMAAAIDEGVVTPSTMYHDTGSEMVDGWHKPIGNAQGDVYGDVSMTQVLENSVNTGMIFVMRQLGVDRFAEYVEAFGFGKKTGIRLDSEAAGTIRSLDSRQEIYAATASFGQGITVTPLQIARAYATIANGGVSKRPYIVEEIRYPDGTVEKTGVQDMGQVIESKTARTIGAMMVSVIEHGHGSKAGVDGYYIAGKTGTAQVANASSGGYDENNTIGSFVGFGPVEDPKFAMVVRIDNPKDTIWAETTAAPLFGKIADFLLTYYEIPPVRAIEE